MTKAVITARIDADTLAALDALAARRERTRAWIVAKAIERYVEAETAFDAFLQEGEDAIARGDYLTHDELVAEIEAMRLGKKAA